MSKNHDVIQERIVRKRWQNELSRKGIFYSEYRPKKRNKSKRAVEHFTFPKNFSIYSADKDKSYQDTINIINAISRFSKGALKKAHLDFSKTEFIKAAAILILYATIEQAINEGVNFKIISFPRDIKAIRIIKRSGLELLCRDNVHKPKFDGDYMPVISGSSGQYRDDIVDFIQYKIYKNKMSAYTESIYGGAIHEAINNVAYHAYPNTHESIQKRWWVKCDLAGDQLFLALYDKGVGIPETVMKRSWYEEILKNAYPELRIKISEELTNQGIAKSEMFLYKVGLVSDAMKIAISMVGDVTGTKSSKHGQGSKSIKALVSENEQGKLWIYSNRGLYKLESDIVETVDLPKPMPGTLLQWNIEVKLDEHKND
ncbi:ATP-binding protein [Serratia fonticola]|uniref:ATP-binding protein n=1 Tax=Serratia fonticola TaxID=47917 RepID=UPI0034C6A4B0